MSTLRAISFDLDGTLINSEGLKVSGDFVFEFMNAFQPRFGLVATLRVLRKLLISKSDYNKSNDNPNTHADLAAQIAASELKLDINEAKELLEQNLLLIFEKMAKHFTLRPQALEFLATLPSGPQKMITTNPVWPKSVVELRMKSAGLDPAQFTSISNSEIYTAKKPNPEFYKQWLKIHQLGPKEAIHIGNDIKNDGAARDAGIPVFILRDQEDLLTVPPRNSGQGIMWIGNWQHLKQIIQEQIE